MWHSAKLVWFFPKFFLSCRQSQVATVPRKNWATFISQRSFSDHKRCHCCPVRILPLQIALKTCLCGFGGKTIFLNVERQTVTLTVPKRNPMSKLSNLELAPFLPPYVTNSSFISLKSRGGVTIDTRAPGPRFCTR